MGSSETADRITELLDAAESAEDAVDPLRAALALHPESRVREAALRAALASYDALARLAGPFGEHAPELFVDRRLRSACHLGLEVERLDSTQLRQLLRPMLRAAHPFEQLLWHPERVTLASRMRLARLCCAMAVVARTHGAERVLQGELAGGFERTLRILIRDRDPVVGVRAAWAMGVCRNVPDLPLSLAQLVEATVQASAGSLEARRALAARTALLVFGDFDEAEYLDDLQEGLGKRDRSARVVAIRALQLGIFVAPELTASIVADIVADAEPVALRAAAAFALDLDDSERASELLDQIRQVAEQREALSFAPLRFLLGPREPLPERLFQGQLELCSAAEQSPQRAHAVACRQLAQLAELRDEPVSEQLEAAFEWLTLDSTLLPNALAVGGALDQGNHAASYARVLQLGRRRRLGHVAAAPPDTEARRAQSWWLTRVLDASPRGQQLGAEAPQEGGDALGEDALEAARLLLEAGGDKRLKRMLERPFAIALMTSLELAVAVGAATWSDVIAALLCLPSKRLLRHCGASTNVAGLSAIIESFFELRNQIDQSFEVPRSSKRGRTARPSVQEPRHSKATVRFTGKPLLAAARSTAAAVKALVGEEEDSPVWNALAAVVRAIAVYMRTVRGAGDQVVWFAWVDAVSGLGEVGQISADRFGLESHPAISADEASMPINVLLREAGLRTPVSEAEFGYKRARSTVRRGLPMPLQDLFDALLALPLPHAKPSARPPDSPFPPGKRVGDFVVDRALGDGGMGWCVLVRRRLEAQNPNAHQLVLKAPREAEGTELFREEARTLIKLSKVPHPGVVQFMGFVDYGYRLPFLLMDYVPGKTLGQAVTGDRHLPLSDTITAGAKIARALAHCHDRGVTHQDLKPDNIILADGDAARPVLVDWGLAGAGVMRGAGTPPYMAPERWLESGPAMAGAPADVFALACTLFEAATGLTLLGEPITEHDFPENPKMGPALASVQPAFRELVVAETLANRNDVQCRRVERALASQMLGFTELLRVMLETDPGARPPASQVATALEALTT